MLFNTLNLIFLNVTVLNCTKKIFTQTSLAGLYYKNQEDMLWICMGNDVIQGVELSTDDGGLGWYKAGRHPFTLVFVHVQCQTVKQQTVSLSCVSNLSAVLCRVAPRMAPTC